MGFSRPEAYRGWVGRWSELLAPEFLRFAGIGESNRILDVGCGTGILGRAIIARLREVRVVGIDPAAAYVDFARTCQDDPRLKFQIGDAQAIPFADRSFDGALALLVLQELSDVPRAVAEMARVTRPGGAVAACQWDFRGGLPMLSHFWKTVEEIHPDPAARDDAATRTQSGIDGTQALVALWSDAGLRSVATDGITLEMAFESFEDYWAPFLSGVSPTTSYAATLPDPLRAKLVGRLRSKLIGEGPDRSFALPARAWAVRGIVP